MNVAYVFPGQGAQKPGMINDILEESPNSVKLIDRASEITGIDLLDVISHGPVERLNDAHISGLSVFCTACVIYDLLPDKIPFAVAGYSVGQYTALTCSGVISFEEGVSLVDKRGHLLKKAAEKSKSTLIGVAGLSLPKLKNLINNIDETYITAYSSPTNHTVSCKKSSAEYVIESLINADAIHVQELAVEGGWHSPFVKEAADAFGKEIETVNFSSPACHYYDNYTGNKLTNIKRLAENLTKHIDHPLLWKQSIENMVVDGVDAFVEIGFGNNLSQFIKFTNRRIKSLQTTPLCKLGATISFLEDNK